MQVPSQVEYERATSVEHALSLLSRLDAWVLAGGHSLIPMMKLRLAQPEMLVDINGLAELAYIRLDGSQLRIGALARHADLLESQLTGQHFPHPAAWKAWWKKNGAAAEGPAAGG